MSAQPLREFNIIAVRYRGSLMAEDVENTVDALASSGVYNSAGIQFTVFEPRISEAQWSSDPIVNLGLIGGKIADSVADGSKKGNAVILTGGNCAHMTGVVGGLQDAHGTSARIGLVWLDAHGDFNTPNTTLTGMLGGMPVAVVAGLGWHEWREKSHVKVPIPTDRIILVDVRNLDPEEERLIRSTDAVIASPAPGFPGVDLKQAVDTLAKRVDMIRISWTRDMSPITGLWSLMARIWSRS